VALGRAKTVVAMGFACAAAVAAIDVVSRPRALTPAPSDVSRDPDTITDEAEVESAIADEVRIEDRYEFPPEWCGNAYPDEWEDLPALLEDDGYCRVVLTPCAPQK
jgi:hypothetical protein